MKIKSYQVTKFRNIVDSGPINVDPAVTCLVGKNEAGKSGLLEALYLFNPAYDEKFDHQEQYPRWLAGQDRKIGDLNIHAPISVTFELEQQDLDAVASELGQGVLTNSQLTVDRRYNDDTLWVIGYDELTAIKNIVANFPESVQTLAEDAEKLVQVRELLNEANACDEEGGISPEDLAAANTMVTGLGLDRCSVWQKIVNILKPRLPQFFRFTGYSTLPGRIDLSEIGSGEDEGPAESGLQTARALLELAGTDIDQLGDDNYELRRSELESVQINLTQQVFEYWTQNPDLEVIIDVDKETVKNANNTTAVARFLDIRLRDRRTGYSNNFSQRSSGFQWFFSFFAAFSEFEGKDSPIVLLDEPALTLHGKAQADFLRFINERLAPSSPVIYTTHSPFMVEIDRLERVRIIEDHGPPTGSTSSDDVLAGDPDSLFPLQAALGYDIAQSLFVGPNNLVVEGTSDFIYLSVMSAACSMAGHNSLDERWRILPAGGATNIPTFVSLIGPHLDVTVVADSDTKGMQRVTNMVERRLLQGHRLILANIATGTRHADIEDLYSEGDFLKLYNKTYGTSLKVNDLPPGDRIVKRIEGHIGNSFVHGEVAEMLLRHHHEISFTDKSLGHFAVLIEEINKTLGT